MATPFPENESLRVAALHQLGILGTPAEERFDRITRFANRLLSTPIALVSLVDSDRQWFKSAQGLNVKETGRDVSFCAHAIIQEKTFFVEDASADARFKDNPLVRGEPHIRMYAGHPIDLGEGLRVGTMCVIDTKPRRLNASEIEIIQNLARWIRAELLNIELDKKLKFFEAKLEISEKKSVNHEKLYDFFNSLTLIDPELRIPNRLYLGLYLPQEINRLKHPGLPIAVMCIAIDDFAGYEKNVGSAAAAQTLQVLAGTLAEIPKWPRGMTFRYSSQLFVILLPERSRDAARDFAEGIRDKVHQLRIAYGKDLLTLSYGICAAVAGSITSEKLIAKAIEALETAQKQGTDKIRYVDPGPV
jgi:diguanylate cyclase (GGDEF)-like protein